MCFSLPGNMREILNTKKPEGIIEAVNGIRVFSLTWVVIGHMLFYGDLYAAIGKLI